MDFILNLLNDGQTVRFNYLKLLGDINAPVMCHAVTSIYTQLDKTIHFENYLTFNDDNQKVGNECIICPSYDNVMWHVSWWHESNINESGFEFIGITAKHED